MRIHHRYLTFFFLIVLFFSKTNAQDTTTTNFYNQIKNYDLSTILVEDSIYSESREEGKEKHKRGEILGFIGDDYQRFFIHFVSVIQNPTNPNEYLVFGKTKVKEVICSFQGTISVRNARMYKSCDIPTYQQGYASCDVILYEDNKQSSTGVIKGKLKCEFLIDDKGQFRYDALMFESDGFSNNQFIGSWTSYKTNKTIKCNWGDYRIPESRNFDIGAGEFSVAEKYLLNGWGNYKLAWGTYPETQDVLSAKRMENLHWWE